MSKKVRAAKIRGLPKRLRRKWKRAGTYYKAAITDGNLLKILRGVPGARIDPDYDPDKVKPYKPVGQCIYCGKKPPKVKLTREHILAYALGGDAVLPESSCLYCADVIKVFESYCTDKVFLHARALNNFHSRTGPKTHLPLITNPITVSPPYRLKPVPVPIGSFPGLLALPSFGIPGIVDGRDPTASFVDAKLHTIRVTDDHDERVSRLHYSGLNNTRVPVEMDLDLFARWLAKTALGIAVAQYGVEAFDSLVEDLILKGVNPAYYVGCTTTQSTEPQQMKHWVRAEVREIQNEKFVCVFLRVFAFLGTPTYSVIVGKLRAGSKAR